MFDVASRRRRRPGRRAGPPRRLVRFDRASLRRPASPIDEPRGYESAGARHDVARVAADARPARRRRRRAGDRRRRRARLRSGSSPAARPRASTAAPIGAIPASNRRSATGTNYGCAINSNLAAMIANPDDLVHGREASGQGAGDRRRPRGQVVSRKPAERPPAASGQPAPRVGNRHERALPRFARRFAPRPLQRLRHRRGDRRDAAADRGRAWLVAGEGQQGRPQERGPDAVGLGEPEHPVRRPFRKRRSAERHQRARRGLRARHGGDRRRPGQRRPPLPRPRRLAASRTIC